MVKYSLRCGRGIQLASSHRDVCVMCRDVKLETERSSERLHILTLFRYEGMGGGFTLTVMELLDPQDGWVLLWGLTGRDAEEALSAALERLEVAHGCLPGGVHGDLRDANFLVRQKERTDC